MSVTRQSLRFKCSVKDCPWPKDEAIHVPWCLGIPDVEHWADKPTHQHHPKKGMGGNNPKSKIVAILCVTCHDRIDNGDWSNDVKDMPGRGLVYFAQDLHGNTLIEKDLDSVLSAAEPEYAERFWSKVDRRGDDECWPWLATRNSGGYGQFWLNGKLEQAYRVSYELIRGPIPEGLTLDHLCRNPPCVNPADLEAVTEKENILRGEGVGAKAARVTHCPKGHPYDKENTRIRANGWRQCITCHRAAGRKKKAAPSAGDKEESDETLHTLQVSGVHTAVSEVRAGPLTHEQRVAIAQAIKDTKQRHQFLAGDTANLWEEELNDEFWSRYADGFGYTYPSLRNVMRVCKRIPPNQRHDEMSFAHHEAVQTLDIETREAWLERSFEEEWPVKRLREELVKEKLLTTKPRVKRWSLEELRVFAVEHHYAQSTNVVRFLNALEEQA